MDPQARDLESGSGAMQPDAPQLPYARQWIDESDVAAVTEVLRSDFLTQGPTVERFEQALAAYCGARHAVAVSSGTAALHLTALALGVGPGQVGVTSPVTFAASANCFLYAGGSVDFADVDSASGLMTPAMLEAVLAKYAAAGNPASVVVAVSLAGCVPDLPGLAAVCGRYGWRLVEDAAHSIGADYRVAEEAFRSASCAHTAAAILSFHPVKHVCSGEGGAVLTNDADLAVRLRRLRTHGIERPAPGTPGADEGGWFYEQTELGYHYRMTDLQAALGASQLARLPAFLERRRALAKRYAQVLGGTAFSGVLIPTPFDAGHGYHLYVVHFRNAQLRRAAYDFLLARGIRTQVHYIPVYRHPHYRRLLGEISRSGAEAWYRGCLSLPLFPRMTDADQDRVLDALAEFTSSHG